MKTFYQIVVVVLTGLLSVACADLGSVYGNTSWYGEYEARSVGYSVSILTSTLLTTTISLSFSEDGQECFAVFGTKGMDGMLYLYDYLGSQYQYDVQWSSGNTFTLSIPLVDRLEGGIEQAIVVYAGKITGRKMKLDMMSCDRVEQTIELKKTD